MPAPDPCLLACLVRIGSISSRVSLTSWRGGCLVPRLLLAAPSPQELGHLSSIGDNRSSLCHKAVSRIRSSRCIDPIQHLHFCEHHPPPFSRSFPILPARLSATSGERTCGPGIPDLDASHLRSSPASPDSVVLGWTGEERSLNIRTRADRRSRALRATKEVRNSK